MLKRLGLIIMVVSLLMVLFGTSVFAGYGGVTLNGSGGVTDNTPAHLVLTMPSATTIVISHSLISETNGKANNNSDVNALVTGLTPISVGLQNTGDTAYAHNVRIDPIGLGANIQFWAEDTADNWYDINVTGWGPSTGFPVSAPYNISTPVYVVSNAVNTYSVTVNLQDVTAGVVATATGTITVPPIYLWSITPTTLAFGTTSVTSGGSVTMTVKATATNDSASTQNITGFGISDKSWTGGLDVYDITVSSSTTTIAPGASATLTFTLTGTAPIVATTTTLDLSGLSFTLTPTP